MTNALRRLLTAGGRYGFAVRLAVVGVSVLLVTLIARTSGGDTAAVPLPTASQAASIARDAKVAATNNGDASVTEATLVASTRGAFDAAVASDTSPQPIGSPEEPVYVVTLHGDFTAYGAATPRGSAYPTGNVLVYVLRAADLTVLDSAPDLAGLVQSEILDLTK
jgi:hypothetical protein